MNCRQVVELMTDYLDGALSAGDRARFEEHIAGCDGCRAYLAQLRTTREVVGRLAEESIPKPVEDELVRAFRNWKGKPG
jgi:anti-sigma factor RsiW